MKTHLYLSSAVSFLHEFIDQLKNIFFVVGFVRVAVVCSSLIEVCESFEVPCQLQVYLHVRELSYYGSGCQFLVFFEPFFEFENWVVVSHRYVFILGKLFVTANWNLCWDLAFVLSVLVLVQLIIFKHLLLCYFSLLMNEKLENLLMHFVVLKSLWHHKSLSFWIYLTLFLIYLSCPPLHFISDKILKLTFI